ncbi:MAG TPA: amino acid adenylation domain-containing protein, partial [Thermoanaerobaculia bacterium]|nr:amino acid adenylation domain-containing protein [Thermoanaerobaculia bacterium]
ARPVLLDRLLPIDDLPAAPAAGEEATAGDLAYVIYTSGSTGRPKGVLLAHRGLADLAEAHVQLFGIGSGSRVLQFASPSFDASVSEIWSALVCGAALVLGRREDLLPGPALAGFLSGRGITHVTLPPTALAALAAAAGETGDGLPPLPDLECLVVAGEAFPAALAARWSAGRRLLNAYGPTEATVCATAAVLAGPAVGLRPPPIGRPVAGSRIYVVDEELRPVPAGKAGELLLGGPGLAWGYIGLPESTAAAFVPDPFARSSGEAGGRLYRTGDRVRFLPDGELEFLGRVDRQVKVRGYRIEPGEVEAALLRHPALGAAAVVAREPDAARGDRRLVAYVVPHGGGAVPAPAELRRFLAAELPDFMIPAAFVALDRLPLSPNGKVDLQALPALPEPGAAAASGLEPAPSRTPVEEVLAGIWAHVLGTPETSPIADDDDFFVLGGHSLLIGEVVSRVRAALGVELPLREAFAAPTFAALAGRVEAALASGRPPLPAVERLDRRGAAGLALSFAQERLWFLHRLAPASPVYNMPSLFRLEGDLDAEALARCLAEIVRRQESLRTTFAEAAGGEPRQAVAPPPAAADLPWIDLRGLPLAAARAEALGWISAEAWRPFDLAAGPLFRPLLFSPAAGDHLLLLAMHHIAGDGESMEVLAGELAAIYPEARTGRPSPLAELPVQYADVAAWQRRRLAGEALAPELEYWRQ